MFNKKLKEKIKEQSLKIDSLNNEVKSLKPLGEINKNILSENDKLVSRVNKAESKVREQTEADLYFECSKIMKKLEIP